MTFFSLIIGSLLQTAAAENCSSYVNQAANENGAGLVRTFAKLARCDKNMAEDNFLGAFLPRATDLDTLVALSETAITAQVWNPTWKMLGKIKDYGTRNDVAAALGEKCSENEKIMKFLQGGYFALKNTDFARWDDAYLACESEELNSWLTNQVENPPSQSFDEKYNTLLNIIVKQKKEKALPTLENAALKAAKNNGPFDSIINQMNASVEPGLGETMSDAQKTALEASLMNIAKEVPEKAELIASQLNAINSSRSGELLQIIYGDRMKDGLLSYGALAVEAGECNGKKQAVIHVVEVTDPAKRMVILQDVTEPLRASKPKLKKCDTGDWPISTTSEPLKSSDELDALVQQIQDKYEADGFKVKVVTESKIALD